MIEPLPIFLNKRELGREAYKFVMTYINKDEIKKIADIFSGTASLSIPFFRHSDEILLNDKYKFMYYYLCFYTDNMSGDLKFETEYFFKHLKNIDLYVGKIYQEYVENKEYSFFGENDAIKIDSIHRYLNEIRGTIPEKALNSIYGNFIYSVYKASNLDTRYFYIQPAKRKAKDNVFKFDFTLANEYFSDFNIKISNEDAKDFIKKHSGDLLIIDPPFKRRYINIYYPLEYLANDPYTKFNKLLYNDNFSFLGEQYIKGIMYLIKRAEYKYIFLYLEDKVYDMFPPLYFDLFICHKMKLKRGYFILLEKT